MPQPPGGIEPFHARFELVNGSIQVGVVDMRLSQVEQGWRFSSVSKPTGLFALFRKDRTDEVSWLAADPAGIRPLRYTFEQTGSRQLKLSSEFDWDRDKVRTRSSNADDNSELDLDPGTQDRLSVLLHLVRAARGGEQRIAVAVNEKGKARNWEFEVKGRERLRTVAGVYDAIRLEQNHEPGARHTVTWLAVDSGYLPIRLDLKSLNP